MSLEKQTVTVPLIDGLGDDDDRWAADPPSFAELDGARWGQDKVIGKRFGFSSIVNGLDGSALADSAREPNAVLDLDGVGHINTAWGTFRENLASHVWEAMNLLTPRPSRCTSDPLVRGDAGFAKSDCAVAGNIVCAVWDKIDETNSIAGAYYAFWDISDDVPRPIGQATKFTIIKEACRIVALANRYFIVAGLDADVNGHMCTTAIDTQSTYVFPAATVGDQITDNQFALDTDYNATTNAFLCYLNFAGPTRILKKLSTAGAVVATKNLGSAQDVQQILHNQPLARVFVVGAGDTVSHVDDALAGAAANVVVFTNPASGAYTGEFCRAVIGRADDAGNMFVARSTCGPHVTLLHPIGTEVAALSTAYAVTLDELLGGVVLSAQMSLYDTLTKRSYLGIANQAAAFSEDRDPGPGSKFTQADAYKAAPVGFVAAMEAVVGAGFTALRFATFARYGQDALALWTNVSTVSSARTGYPSSHLPHLTANVIGGDPVYLTAYPVMQGDVLGGNPANRKFQIDLARVRIHHAPPAQNVNAQSLRILGQGAGSTVIDGNMHAEMTPAAPEWLSMDGYGAMVLPAVAYPHSDTTGTPWGGAPNPNKQWGFVVVWRYTDARGNVHRSAPSSVYYTLLAQLVSAGSLAGKLVFPPWRPSALEGDRGVPEAEIYACPYDGGNDFRLLGIVLPKKDGAADEGRVYVEINTTSVAPVVNSVSVTTWDAVNPVPRSLYTQDELEAWPSPALLSICSTESRLWGLNGEDRLDVWVTKPIVLGYAPEWSSVLRVRVPQDGGPAVGIAALDDKVIVFKQRKVFVIEGDPGDPNGDNSSLRQPRLVSGDVGCDSVNSIVEGPFGVIFHSEKGFITIDRGLQFSYVGDKAAQQTFVNSTVDLVVVSSSLVPSESEVRFVLDVSRGGGSAAVLVWNYRFNRWTRRNALAPTFSGVVDGREISVIDSGTGGNTVFRETLNDWTQEGPEASGVHLKFRTSWIKLNGIAGFGRLWRAVFLFRWYTGGIRIRTAQDYRPDTETWKTWTQAEVAAAVSGDRLELAISPTVQKCEAVQFVVEEYTVEGNVPGRGFELLGVTLECGVKNGAYKRLAAAVRK